MSLYKKQALNLKKMAELKFENEDYVEARKLAQEAHAIFPWLNIHIFFTIIDIYLSYKKTVDGQSDFYGVFGLENTASLENIYEKHFKLYEQVMGGKNHKIIGIDGALNMLLEAFSKLTGEFWTMCPRCQVKFHYSNDILNKESVCSNCNKHYLAVPLSFGTPLTNPRFNALERSVIIALRAPSRHVGGSGPSKRR